MVTTIGRLPSASTFFPRFSLPQTRPPFKPNNTNTFTTWARRNLPIARSTGWLLEVGDAFLNTGLHPLTANPNLAAQITTFPKEPSAIQRKTQISKLIKSKRTQLPPQLRANLSCVYTDLIGSRKLLGICTKALGDKEGALFAGRLIASISGIYQQAFDSILAKNPEIFAHSAFGGDGSTITTDSSLVPQVYEAWLRLKPEVLKAINFLCNENQPLFNSLTSAYKQGIIGSRLRCASLAELHEAGIYSSLTPENAIVYSGKDLEQFLKAQTHLDFNGSWKTATNKLRQGLTSSVEQFVPETLISRLSSINQRIQRNSLKLQQLLSANNLFQPPRGLTQKTETTLEKPDLLPNSLVFTAPKGSKFLTALLKFRKGLSDNQIQEIQSQLQTIFNATEVERHQNLAEALNCQQDGFTLPMPECIEFAGNDKSHLRFVVTPFQAKRLTQLLMSLESKGIIISGSLGWQTSQKIDAVVIGERSLEIGTGLLTQTAASLGGSPPRQSTCSPMGPAPKAACRQKALAA